MRVLSTIAFFVASTLAITVTQPASNATWNANVLTQVISWTSVSTDPTNMTIVLSNQQINPPLTQELKALVVTSTGTTTVSPPASGWPTGSGYQINIVRDSSNLNAILAQSQTFNITSASGSSSALVMNPTTYFASATTGFSSSSTAGANNGAVGTLNVQAGFIAAVGFLGAVLV